MKSGKIERHLVVNCNCKDLATDVNEVTEGMDIRIGLANKIVREHHERSSHNICSNFVRQS